eukprot:1580328-Alexandrium_andersonii.AAC.1
MLAAPVEGAVDISAVVADENLRGAREADPRLREDLPDRCCAPGVAGRACDDLVVRAVVHHVHV